MKNKIEFIDSLGLLLSLTLVGFLALNNPAREADEPYHPRPIKRLTEAKIHHYLHQWVATVAHEPAATEVMYSHHAGTKMVHTPGLGWYRVPTRTYTIVTFKGDKDGFIVDGLFPGWSMANGQHYDYLVVIFDDEVGFPTYMGAFQNAQQLPPFVRSHMRK